MGNFSFLLDWPEALEAAGLAEGAARSDARSCAFHARRTLELLVGWLFEHDAAFGPLPFEGTLAAMCAASGFVNNVPWPVRADCTLVRKLGNVAVHDPGAFSADRALESLRALWETSFWVARTYGSGPPEGLPAAFDPSLLPPSGREAALASRAELERRERDLQERDAEAAALRASLAAQDLELEGLRAQVAARKAQNARVPLLHEFDEARTRAELIDLLLREAGWDPGAENVREYPVSGVPSKSGSGRVDYVLWAEDGLPLAVVEAKRTATDANVGRQQGLVYARALAAQFGRFPAVFYSNGVETHLLEGEGAAPRPVAGFYSRLELEWLHARLSGRRALAGYGVDKAMADRAYQEQAIRAFGEHVTAGHRRGLVVMATGTGKTRMAVALVDLLQRAGWVKRVLFLADREVLVRQAAGAFKKFLPGSPVVNLLEGREDAALSRVVVSTYQTMINLIDSARLAGGARQFGPGHFDLIIVDEAHRSIYRKFGAIFEYFDGLLLGLTATPRDEVDRNTYRLFEMQEGLPLFSYGLEEAVADGYLTPPVGVDSTPKFLRDGILYDDLKDDEKAEWDDLEWDEWGGRREEVKAGEVNEWLFNQSTVDLVLRDLMLNGLKVQDGDRLGKTILFAQNHNHAQYIVKRFEANYPMLGGFARVIDHFEPYAQSLIEEFSSPEARPVIAVSVDMLDTGLDVPEVLNLVLFKKVRSKTKFLQMLGRGTRLRPDLLGPGRPKTVFKVFDYCGNFEFFNVHPKGLDSKDLDPAFQRLFKARLKLLAALAPLRAADESLAELYASVADELCARVQAMPLDNFIVRPKRGPVETFSGRERWNALDELDLLNLARDLSGLPTGLEDGDETTRRFDEQLVLLQLAALNGTSDLGRRVERLQGVAARLEKKANVPAVSAKLPLLRRLQQDDTWEDMTPAGLETVRQRLRDLVPFMDPLERAVLYTDFEDELGAGDITPIPTLAPSVDLERYRRKVEAFLRASEQEPAMVKLRTAQPLTPEDLARLESLLLEAGGSAGQDAFARAFGPQPNLPAFIRRIVGLDRKAAKQAFNAFLNGQTLSGAQLGFIEYIIDALARTGVVEPGLLYEPPFTNLHYGGLDGLFPGAQAERIVQILAGLNASVNVGARAGQ